MNTNEEIKDKENGTIVIVTILVLCNIIFLINQFDASREMFNQLILSNIITVQNK